MDELTSAERKVATAMLADYPFAGLMNLVELAERARTSSQTILRLVAKLDFQGYGEFQRALIKEIKEGYHSPLILHETTEHRDENSAFLSGLSEATIAAIRESINGLSEQQFLSICGLLSDPKRSLFLIGGRMSHTLAMFLFRHLRQVRPKVYLISENEEEWPEYLMRMAPKDIVMMIDFRRYQKNLEHFAGLISENNGAKIVLFTDKWLSPISKFSTHTLPTVVDVDTPWDTALPMMLVAEAIINRVSERDWDATRKRLENWDRLRGKVTPNSQARPTKANH